MILYVLYTRLPCFMHMAWHGMAFHLTVCFVSNIDMWLCPFDPYSQNNNSCNSGDQTGRDCTKNNCLRREAAKTVEKKNKNKAQKGKNRKIHQNNSLLLRLRSRRGLLAEPLPPVPLLVDLCLGAAAHIFLAPLVVLVRRRLLPSRLGHRPLGGVMVREVVGEADAVLGELPRGGREGA